MTGTSELMSKFSKLENKNFRHAYISDHIRIGIATQIRLLRNKENLTQAGLAKIIGTKQAVISRLEDPDSGSANLNTLLKIAKAFDVSLIAKFVSFGKFLEESKNISPADLTATNFITEFTNIKQEEDNAYKRIVLDKNKQMNQVFKIFSDMNLGSKRNSNWGDISDPSSITHPIYKPVATEQLGVHTQYRRR